MSAKLNKPNCNPIRATKQDQSKADPDKYKKFGARNGA
jgi:hypothetical protein